MPRFIVLIRSHPSAESHAPPRDHIHAMSTYHASLKSSGILLSGEGLHPSNHDAFRITFSDHHESKIRQGPFKHDLVSGYWMFRAKDAKEALDWALKAPMRSGDELEVRRVFEAEDLGRLEGEVRHAEKKVKEGSGDRLGRDGKFEVADLARKISRRHDHGKEDRGAEKHHVDGRDIAHQIQKHTKGHDEESHHDTHSRPAEYIGELKDGARRISTHHSKEDEGDRRAYDHEDDHEGSVDHRESGHNRKGGKLGTARDVMRDHLEHPKERTTRKHDGDKTAHKLRKGEDIKDGANAARSRDSRDGVNRDDIMSNRDTRNGEDSETSVSMTESNKVTEQDDSDREYREDSGRRRHRNSGDGSRSHRSRGDTEVSHRDSSRDGRAGTDKNHGRHRRSVDDVDDTREKEERTDRSEVNKPKDRRDSREDDEYSGYSDESIDRDQDQGDARAVEKVDKPRRRKHRHRRKRVDSLDDKH